MWKQCRNCGDPFPNVPGVWYCCGLCENEGNCVVCLVGNGELEHDHADHQVAGYHEVDGIPTSEECPGMIDCPDCTSVLEGV